MRGAREHGEERLCPAAFHAQNAPTTTKPRTVHGQDQHRRTGAYMLIMSLSAEARCAEMYLSPVSSSDIGDTPAASRGPPPIPM